MKTNVRRNNEVHGDWYDKDKFIYN